MSSPFAPRQAKPGQRITYTGPGGELHRLEAEDLGDGRWVIVPRSNGDEAAVTRHRLPVDAGAVEILAAREAPAPELAGDALEERARVLDIPGRSRMTADQLREAIAEREATQDDGADEPSEEE